MASISLTAEGLISSLYLATPPQIFQDFFKRQVGSKARASKAAKSSGILSQAKLYRLIDQFGHRLLRLGGLEPQGPVQVWIENSWWPFSAKISCSNCNPITLRRQDRRL